MVQAPTRITSHSSGNLDVLLSNIPNQFSDIVTNPFSRSDHLLVSALFHPRGDCRDLRKKPKLIHHRKYHKLSDSELARLQNVLTDELWEEVVSLNDVDACVTSFNLIASSVLGLLFPLKQRTVKINLPSWNLNPETTNARYMRNEAHKAAIRENTPEACQRYQRIRNRTTSMLHSCRAKHLADLSAEFWKHFSHMSDSS